MSDPPHSPRAHSRAARAALREEQTLRARWDATEASLRERFDEPLSRAVELTEKTLAWFPIRVWRHFLQHNGFLLAAGVSYQALFAFFAAVSVAFAGVGLWLGGSEDAVSWLIGVINYYIPNLIEHGGLIEPKDVQQIADNSASVLGWAGLVSLVVLVWTAIGWVTYSRRAVRDIFGLPPDLRSYLLLKARDLLAALVFGIALVIGGSASAVATWALQLIFDLLGWSTDSTLFHRGTPAVLVLFSFVLNAAALAGLFRFLTGTSLRWRRIWPGSVVGGVGMTVLQLGAGLLLSYTPTNPLLTTFAVFIVLLLWFRLLGVVMLVASSWIAVSTSDAHLPLIKQSEQDRLIAEHQALLVAARVRLRTAREARLHASWYRTISATREVRRAERELIEVEAAAPATNKTSPDARERSSAGRG